MTTDERIRESVNFDLRTRYAASLEQFVEKQMQEAERRRTVYTKTTDAKTRKEAYLSMLGLPLPFDPGEACLTASETLLETDTETVRRMQFSISGIQMYGILFLPKGKSGPLPFSFFQHGALGTPEIACTLIGSSANYNDAVKRMTGHGIAVFAPQLLTWDKDRYQSPYDRQNLNLHLIQLGCSFKALEMVLLQKLISFFAKEPYIDAEKIGFAGLSWGGMYALCMGALDERIRVTLSSCYFNDRAVYDSAEWIHPGQAQTFFDAEVGALILPRALCIQCGMQDPLFSSETAGRERKRLEDYHEVLCPGQDNLYFDFFDGGHEFAGTGDALFWFVKKLTE